MKRARPGKRAQGQEIRTRIVARKHVQHVQNRLKRLAVIEGGVLIAATDHKHLERVLPDVLAMIERSRLAVRNARD
jgi:hypothetical protein